MRGSLPTHIAKHPMKDKILALQAALQARQDATPTTHGGNQLLHFRDLLKVEALVQEELDYLASHAPQPAPATPTN